MSRNFALLLLLAKGRCRHGGNLTTLAACLLLACCLLDCLPKHFDMSPCRACWDQDVAHRPSFQHIVDDLWCVCLMVG